MNLGKTDPHLLRNKFLLIRCPESIEYNLPHHPDRADGVLAYCYLDPFRGYRLFICEIIHCRPLELYENFYVSMDIAYSRMSGMKAEIYSKDLSEVNATVQKMIYEIRKSVFDNVMQRMSRMEMDGWKVMRKTDLW